MKFFVLCLLICVAHIERSAAGGATHTALCLEHECGNGDEGTVIDVRKSRIESIQKEIDEKLESLPKFLSEQQVHDFVDDLNYDPSSIVSDSLPPFQREIVELRREIDELRREIDELEAELKAEQNSQEFQRKMNKPWDEIETEQRARVGVMRDEIKACFKQYILSFCFGCQSLETWKVYARDNLRNTVTNDEKRFDVVDRIIREMQASSDFTLYKHGYISPAHNDDSVAYFRDILKLMEYYKKENNTSAEKITTLEQHITYGGFSIKRHLVEKFGWGQNNKNVGATVPLPFRITIHPDGSHLYDGLTHVTQNKMNPNMMRHMGVSENTFADYIREADARQERCLQDGREYDMKSYYDIFIEKDKDKPDDYFLGFPREGFFDEPFNDHWNDMHHLLVHMQWDEHQSAIIPGW